MADFRKMEVKSEPTTGKEMRVVKLETPEKPEVVDFQYNLLQVPGTGDYAATQKQFGALAATDSARHSKSRKDSRFSVNPLLREPLSIEEEERRVIEEKVRSRVSAVADEAKARAAEQGYQDGLKKGYEEAFKRFQKEGADRLARFDGFLEQAERAKLEIFQANERFLMELVFRVARAVALKELSSDPEYPLRIARDLLERVGVRENIRIRLNPEQLSTASLLKEGLEQSLGQLKNLSIEASPQVHSLGCLVETQWNSIDATFETQMKGIYEALMSGASAGSGITGPEEEGSSQGSEE